MSTTTKPTKPLGQRAYGSIPHLPGSRRGPGDRGLSDDQARILIERTRDRHDTVVVQEKLDGSCVSVAKLDGRIVPLIRAGYPAVTSHYKQHRFFHMWAIQRTDMFDELLDDGERVCGEWLMQAHGTRYQLWHEPFVAFDIMCGHERVTHDELYERTAGVLSTPALLHEGGACSIDHALHALGEYGRHGALDPVEGAVWRVERKGKVDFLGKYVRPGKVDGCYLESITGGEPVYNIEPQTIAKGQA